MNSAVAAGPQDPRLRTGSRGRDVALALAALALAASPAYTIRFGVGPFPSTVLEVLLVAAILAGLWATRGRLPWRNPYTWPAALLLLGATLDVVFAPSHREAAGAWKAYFIEPALTALVMAGLATTAGRVRVVLGGLGAAGVIVAVAQLSVALPDIARRTYNVVTPQVAIFNSANDVALFLVPLAALALALALHDTDRRTRVAAGAFYLLAALAAVISYSRGGWLALLVSSLFVALFHRLRWWIAGAAVALAALAGLGSSGIRRRILVELSPHDPNNTIALRLPLWRTALRMLEHHPLFGGGLAGFQASAEPYRDPGYRESLIYPHDVVLNFWSETGLIGLAGFLWLCAWLVRHSLPLLRDAAAPFRRAVGVGVLAALVAIGVHGLVDVPYFKNDLALEFWALAGIQLAAMRLSAGG